MSCVNQLYFIPNWYCKSVDLPVYETTVVKYNMGVSSFAKNLLEELFQPAAQHAGNCWAINPINPIKQDLRWDTVFSALY